MHERDLRLDMAGWASTRRWRRSSTAWRATKSRERRLRSEPRIASRVRTRAHFFRCEPPARRPNMLQATAPTNRGPWCRYGHVVHARAFADPAFVPPPLASAGSCLRRNHDATAQTHARSQPNLCSTPAPTQAPPAPPARSQLLLYLAVAPEEKIKYALLRAQRAASCALTLLLLAGTSTAASGRSPASRRARRDTRPAPSAGSASSPPRLSRSPTTRTRARCCSGRRRSASSTA